MQEPSSLLKLPDIAGTSRPDGGERSSRSMDAESRPGPVVTDTGRSFIELLGDGIPRPGLMHDNALISIPASRRGVS